LEWLELRSDSGLLRFPRFASTNRFVGGREQISTETSLGNTATGIDCRYLPGDYRQIILADNNDFRPRSLFPDNSDCLDSVHSGHENIHEHKIRAQGSRLFDSVEPVYRFTAYYPVRTRRQQQTEAASDSIVVINDKDTQHIHRISSEVTSP
jgi:hypothetical protein